MPQQPSSGSEDIVKSLSELTGRAGDLQGQREANAEWATKPSKPTTKEAVAQQILDFVEQLDEDSEDGSEAPDLLPKTGREKKSNFSKPTTGDEARDAAVSVAAKQFVLLEELFIRKSWFPKATKNASEQHPDVYASIPSEYQDFLLNSPHFYKLFMYSADHSVRVIISNLRNKTAQDLFQFQHLQEFYKYNKDRSEVEEFKRLVKWPATKDRTLIKKRGYFLPIHFPNREFDLSVAFKCQELAMVTRSILFGPSSLEKKVLENPNWRPHGKTNGVHWNLKGVTPGLLAFVATIAVLLHNTDHHLATVGSKSGFEYDKAYASYKKHLTTALEAGGSRAEELQELFKWYNEIVFPKPVPTPEEIARERQEREREQWLRDQAIMEEMMRALRMGSTEAD